MSFIKNLIEEKLQENFFEEQFADDTDYQYAQYLEELAIERQIAEYERDLQQAELPSFILEMY